MYSVKESKMLKYKKLYDDADKPYIGSLLAAGADLKAYKDYVLKPYSITKIQTGLAITVPDGTYGKIENRSSMALKDIEVYGGVIDRDYTGEIIVLLKNNNSFPYNILRGDRIAQIVCIKIEQIVLKEIQNCKETLRGDQGFGSTGK